MGTTTRLPGVVVPTDWLEARLERPDLRVIDMREADAHRAAHVPGAAHLSLARLGTTERGLENVLLGAEAFSALMEELGVSSDSAVVAYDDQWGLAASRLVWALHVHGHERVAVLDGGWDRWLEERRLTSEAHEPVPKGRFTAAPGREVAATADWLRTHVSRADVVLLDTRTPGEFGQGHLPGAHSWDWFNAVPEGSWDVARDIEELRAEWATLGATPEREVVVYCRSGMRAAHTYVALKLAGYDRVRLYDGSWQEWSMTRSDVDEP